MAFLACSMPLRIASGTSCAFPNPAPTDPFPSPTTTTALNRKRRPPLTTLAVLFIAITLSRSSSSSIVFLLSTDHAITVVLRGLKIQSRFPRAVGQRLYPSVVEKPATVKDAIPDADLLEAFCQELPHGSRHLNLFFAAQGISQFFAERGCLSQGSARIVGYGLDIDVRR